MFEVFFDTIVICTLTALVILCGAGTSGYDGAALTAYAFEARLGSLGSTWFRLPCCCLHLLRLLPGIIWQNRPLLICWKSWGRYGREAKGFITFWRCCT